jgi:putative transcriptional regulator
LKQVLFYGNIIAEVKVMLKYKIDVLATLKEKGYNTNKIRTEKIMGEAMLQKIRKGEMVSWSVFEKLCDLLDCQPADLIEYISGE